MATLNLTYLLPSFLASLGGGEAIFMIGIGVVVSILMVEGARQMTVGMEDLFPTYNKIAPKVLFGVFLVACDGIMLMLFQDPALFVGAVVAQIIWIAITSLAGTPPVLSGLLSQAKQLTRKPGTNNRFRPTKFR